MPMIVCFGLFVTTDVHCVGLLVVMDKHINALLVTIILLKCAVITIMSIYVWCRNAMYIVSASEHN